MYGYPLPLFALQNYVMIGKYGQKFSIECRKMSEITIVLLYFAYAKRKPIATWSSASSRVFPRLPASSRAFCSLPSFTFNSYWLTKE